MSELREIETSDVVPARRTRAPRLVRLAQQLTLVGLRGANTLAKFALAIYTARYLGLAELGLYGLVTGAASLAPAMFGLGLSDIVSRHTVRKPLAETLPLMAGVLALGTAIHLVAQPAAWAVNAYFGAPVPWHLLFAIGLILLLDHLAAEANLFVIIRGRAYLANALLFVRAGLWPPVVIVWGLLDPSARTIEHLFLGWCGGLILMWLILASLLIPKRRWRALGLQWRWLFAHLRQSLPFYVKDLNDTATIYIDRFLISLLLGLELTGVYTFFWSVANVVHSVAFGVVQPHMAALVAAGGKAGASDFRPLQQRMLLETAGWALMLALGVSIVMPYLLPLLDRPLLQAQMTVFWIIMLATLARLAADAYNLVLFALKRDRAFALTGVGGTIGSVLTNLTLIPLMGLMGAALAYLVTNAGVVSARVLASRQGGQKVRRLAVSH